MGLVLASYFYADGGRSGKWRRRFLASFILALTVNLLCVFRGIWHWGFLLIFPLLSVSFHLGYGADETWMKIIRRSIYALGVLASGAIFVLIFGKSAVWIFLPHAGIGAWSIYMGVKNPLEAAVEEFLICMMLNLGLIAYPFLS